MALACPSLAQTTQGATDPSTNSTTAAPTAPAPRATAADNSADIIVTARRREESLTRVPVSVTVLSGDSLAQRGILRVDDLQRATPAVRATPTAGRRSNSQYEIRGITTLESLITSDPAVGVYVNEVYRARATGTNQSFFDVANVQVLYGPQGTLFGRNSTGGAVLITSNKPTDEMEGELSFGYGNFDRRELTAMLNLPLTEKLAVRFAGQRIKRDGYGRNVTNGTSLSNENSYAGRVSVAFNPTETIENLTVASYYEANEAGTLSTLYAIRDCPPAGVTPRPAATCSPAFRPGVLAAFARQQQLGEREVAGDAFLNDYGPNGAGGVAVPNASQYERPRNFSVSNATTFELSDTLTLKNIFGYNYVGLSALTDLDATPIKLIDTYYETKVKQISEELQLQGDSEKFNWVVGALYFRERGRDLQTATQLVAVVTRQNLLGINKSYAAFAQGTYELTDQLSLTAGGRYTIDKRSASYDNPTTQIGAGPAACSFPTSVVPAGTPCFVQVNKTFKKPTYTVTLDYKPSPDILLYASHRLGYRAGGFNARVANSPIALAPFGPETVRDVELGFKGTVRFDNGGFIRPTLAAYHAWYDDIQRQTTINLPPPGPALATVIINAAKARVKGFEATLTVSPVRDLEFYGFVGYVDGHYKNFATATGPIRRIPFTTSKLTAGGNVNWTFVRDPSLGVISAQAGYSYRSPFFSENSLPLVDPESRVPRQHDVNAAIDWNDIGGSNFSLTVWGRNLNNQRRILGGNSFAGAFGLVPLNIGDPRMYGATVKLRFGGNE